MAEPSCLKFVQAQPPEAIQRTPRRQGTPKGGGPNEIFISVLTGVALSLLRRPERFPRWGTEITGEEGSSKIMSFRIPPSEREYVAAFVTTKPEVLDALVNAIQRCSPALMQGDLSAEISTQLVGVAGAEKPVIDAALRTLLAMYGVLRESQGLSASAASAEALETIRKGEKFGTPPDGWDAFGERLERLLSDDRVLGLSAKAVSVATENPRHAHGFRVLTDARPIFGEDPAAGPLAFAIIHTLQVEHFENNQVQEWFVALDGEDLENLRDTAQRALAKERSLKNSVERLGVPVLTWKVGKNG